MTRRALGNDQTAQCLEKEDFAAVYAFAADMADTPTVADSEVLRIQDFFGIQALV